MTTAPASTVPAPWLQFICEVCGLIYDEALGDPDSGLPAGTRFADIPDDWGCPICGVSKADFVLYTPPAAVAAQPRVARRPTRLGGGRRGDGVLIVGAGRAGWQVAQALRERDADLPIIMVCACAGDVYDKPQLSVAVARGTAVGDLVRETGAAAAQRLQVRLLPEASAIHLDPATRTLRTTRGTLRWRHLVLAHGAEPALPAALQHDRVWRINDLAAYAKLRTALARGPQRVTFIGAGLVGCELANDLALAGHRITLLDVQPVPLASQLPAAAGRRLLAAWAGLPIRFIGNARVSAVERQPDGSLHVHTLDGGRYEADQVVAAIGLRTAGRLARSAGLAFDHIAGGIAVNSRSGATSQAGIYALGDCAVVDGRASRFIEPIGRQARAIADAITAAMANDINAINDINGTPQSRPADPTIETSVGPPPLLRVKTSSLPITLTGTATGACHPDGHWHIDRDDTQALHMRCLASDGALLATLVATTTTTNTTPRPQAPTPG